MTGNRTREQRAAAALLVVATLVPGFLTKLPVVSVLGNLAFVCLFAAIAIAVLKYRLYDIDIVISKAVLYGSLAVFIPPSTRPWSSGWGRWWATGTARY